MSRTTWKELVRRANPDIDRDLARGETYKLGDRTFSQECRPGQPYPWFEKGEDGDAGTDGNS